MPAICTNGGTQESAVLVNLAINWAMAGELTVKPKRQPLMLKDLLNDRKRCQELGAQAREFVEAQAGASAQATQRIGQWLPTS